MPHEFCKSDGITCAICESLGICQCADEQPISGFHKNDQTVEQEMRMRLRDFQSRQRSLNSQGYPQQTSLSLATQEFVEDKIPRSQKQTYENQLDRCTQTKVAVCPNPACFFIHVCTIRKGEKR
jgi:hypothetical protein